MKVIIDGVEVFNYIEKSLFISEDVNARSTGNIRFLKKNKDFDLLAGQTIEIYNNENILIFSGIINRPRKVELSPGSTIIGIDAELLDVQGSLNRRTIAESYTNKTLKNIVLDIYDRYLQDENLTLGEIEEGPIITAAVFPYMPISDVFDELAEISGFNYWITPQRVLNFVNRNTFVSPWQVTPDYMPIVGVEVESNLNKYRNRQYVRAGQDMTNLRTERFKGDGTQQNFVVGYKVAKKPTIELNGIEVNPDLIGIRGLDFNKHWYWSKNEKEITQDQLIDPIQDGDTLTVKYNGLYPIVVVAENPAEIDTMKDRQIGSGIFEALEQNPKIDSTDAALEYAEGKLQRYGRINTRLKFRTFIPGLKAGQIMKCNLPHYEINGEFLITKIEIKEPKRGLIEYNVELVDGEDVNGWEAFFKKLAEKGQDFVIRENEVLILLQATTERTGWRELTEFEAFACKFPNWETTTWLEWRDESFEAFKTEKWTSRFKNPSAIFPELTIRWLPHRNERFKKFKTKTWVEYFESKNKIIPC